MRPFRGSKLFTALAAVTLGASMSLAAAAPAQAVSGIIVTIGWSPLTGSEWAKTANAVCPAGKVVLGGGADIVGGGNEVRLTAMIPAAPGMPVHSYCAAAMEDGAYAADWTLYTWAICGNPIGQQYIQATSVSSSINKRMSVACPAGTKVHGTGAAVFVGPDEDGSAMGQKHLNRIGLFGAGALAGVDVAAHEDQTGYAGNWTTTVFAVCAP